MLGILIWGILCISGFILYDKFLSEQKNESKSVIKEKQETQKESSKEDVLDIYSNQVQDLCNRIHNYVRCEAIEYNENNMSVLSSKECIEKSNKYKLVFTIDDNNYVLTDIQKVEE